jgi:phosphatidylglycerophosphate synthase
VAPGRRFGFHAPVRRYAAHAVTLLRPALAPCFAAAVVAAEGGGSGWIAAALFAVVAASDALDGRLARRFGTASSTGRALDHGADITFLLVALSTYVWIGAAPWWVPAAIGASFAAYAVDSRWRPDVQPRWMANRIGHTGGVANYVLVGVLVGNHSVGLAWLPPLLMQALFVAVPIYSGLAIAGRLMARR